jgi:hypothetical protein
MEEFCNDRAIWQIMLLPPSGLRRTVTAPAVCLEERLQSVHYCSCWKNDWELIGAWNRIRDGSP